MAPVANSLTWTDRRGNRSSEYGPSGRLPSSYKMPTGYRYDASPATCHSSDENLRYPIPFKGTRRSTRAWIQTVGFINPSRARSAGFYADRLKASAEFPSEQKPGTFNLDRVMEESPGRARTSATDAEQRYDAFASRSMEQSR